MDKKIFCIKCGKEITDLTGCHELIEYKNVAEGTNLMDYVKETQPGGESLGYFCQECGDYLFEHDEERGDFISKYVRYLETLRRQNDYIIWSKE